MFLVSIIDTIFDMAEFISTFTTGFQGLVQKTLSHFLPEAKIINVYDGMIHYKYDGNSRNIEKVIYFNNTFFVLKFFKNAQNFKFMCNSVCAEKKYFLINKGTFRIRFNQENQFAKVDKNIARKAEDFIVKNSKLTVDRVNPGTEFWFCIRREGFGFCGQLISKREFTEKNLNKGELRPEVAYFLSVFADIEKSNTVADFFAGYGSIPVQIVKNFDFEELFVSDISENQVKILNEKKILQRQNVHIFCDDAFELKNIKDKSIERIITDPPWGFYEDIGDIKLFYEKMLKNFERILSENGKIVILTARKNEFELAVKESSFEIKENLNTLVNGKKAALYKIERR